MQSKEIIRKELLKQRQNMSEREVIDKSKKITKNLLDSGIFEGSKTVLSYLPLGNEVKTDEIHRFLWEKKIAVFVPFTDEEYNIKAAKLEQGSELCDGKFRVKIPKNLEFFDGTPDIILVPCVGMDKEGNRIGFGKGCYDRYLKEHKTKTVAILYQFQVVSSVEVFTYDIPIEKILTEEGFIK